MKKSAYVWTGAAVALIGAVAVGTALLLQPEPLTGDAAADRACVAMTRAVMENGELSKTRLLTMPSDEKREIAAEIAQHAEQSTIPAFQDLAGEVALAGSMGDGLFGTVGYVSALGKLAEACTSNGWTAVKAGLYEVPER